MLRNEPECEENKGFIHFTRYNYLIRLRDNLPVTVLDKSWINAPRLVKEVRLEEDQYRKITLRTKIACGAMLQYIVFCIQRFPT